MTNRKTWIIAYDVTCPRRLKRVHKLLAKHAFALQYSVFTADLTSKDLERLTARLARVINPAHDDVRFYAVSHAINDVVRGGGRLPNGVLLFGKGAADLAGGLRLTSRR